MGRLFGWLVLALAGLLGTGCGGTPDTVEVQAPAGPVLSEQPPPPPPSIGDHIDLSLAALLDKPRADLALMADEVQSKIRRQELAYLEGKLDLAFLPDLRFSIVVPVFQQAKYSARAGFSLPPYLTEPAKDPTVALHLARFGDIEAAQKLGPDDGSLKDAISALRMERNYPVEWTRLVGLLLHASQVRLATGDLEGATELACLHKQVREILGPKAAQGPLGATLLSRGHRAFSLASETWKRENRHDLARQSEVILTGWGDLPQAILGVESGTPRANVVPLFGGLGQGHAIVAQPMERTLDLLGLPLPREGVEMVLACMDAKEQLAEVVVFYHARINERFPDPARLSLLMEDYDPSTEETAKAGWWRERTYSVAGVSCELVMATRGTALGAVARFYDPKKPAATPELGRDFGAVSLNRSFEQNRSLIAPNLDGATIKVDQSKVLARITNLLPSLPLMRVLLYKAGESRVTSQVTLQYNVSREMLPLYKIAVPLWAAGGACRFEPSVQTDRDYVTAIWEDGQTRYTLRLPAGDAPLADLTFEDRRGVRELTDRAKESATFDRGERKARFDAKNPIQRIRRSVPEFELVQLGMRRGEVKEALGEREDQMREIPGGLVLTFAGDPAGKASYILRQLFVRFDANDRVAELRARYHDTESSPAASVWTKELMQWWKTKCGAPEKLPAPWAAVWADLPGRTPAAAFYRWRDDVTLVTCQIDGSGAEVVLRECPPEYEFGAPMAALTSLPRGLPGCALGDAKEKVMQKLGMPTSATGEDGGVAFKPKQGGAYDSVRVWFGKDDKVVRIRARHVPKKEAQPLSEELQEIWGEEMKTLGWARRQDLSAQKELQGLGWEDDTTRLRIYWERADKEPGRMFSEWKAIP